MTEPGSITVVPSVHFSRTHHGRVREAIRDEAPDVVAVELGETRYDRLDRDEDRSMRSFLDELSGPTAAAYSILQALQRTVVNLYGMDPTRTDMETAIETAAELDLEVALIDDPIERTLEGLVGSVGPFTVPRAFVTSATMTPAERLEQLEALRLPFEEIEHGDDVEPVVRNLRRLFPELASVLVDRRDEAMARRLHALRSEGLDVVAIVGAAHHNGIEAELAALEEADAEPVASVPVRTPSVSVTRIQIS